MNPPANKYSDHVNTEKCILCGNDTEIPVSAPIDYRKYYIQGCGQLCKDCYHTLKLASNSGNRSSNEEMELLLQLTRKDS